MTKTVTASEAKNKLGALLADVQRDQGAVIVVNRGVPTAAIIAYPVYEQLQQYLNEKRRSEARATLMRLQREMAQQNRDLTADEATDLARRVVSETVEELTQQGKIRFVE